MSRADVYRRLRAEGLCVDGCGRHARTGKVRCAECGARCCAGWRDRRRNGRPTEPRACRRCGRVGHNRRSCFWAHPPTHRIVCGAANGAATCGAVAWINGYIPCLFSRACAVGTQ